MKSSNEHIPFLDCVRGVAILAVFLFHCYKNDFTLGTSEVTWNGWLPDYQTSFNNLALLLPKMGQFGVAIFFVISGFCIHLSHEKIRDKDWGVFFLRRFFRIYPPYLVALLIFACVFPATRLDFSSSFLHTRPHYFFSSYLLGVHVLLIHNFSEYAIWTINGSFWSIAVEVQLYILYPLLLLFAKRLGWIGVLWITAAIELSMRGSSELFDIHSIWLMLNPFYFWFSWTVGAALADAHLKKQPLPFAGRLLFFYPALLVIASQFKPLFPFSFTLASLSTVYVASYLLRNSVQIPTGATSSGFLFDLLRSAGLISYSFYLIHEPLLDFWAQCLLRIYSGHHVPMVCRFLLCIPALFVLLIPSYIFYRYLELPSIAYGKRLIEMWRRKKMESIAPPAHSNGALRRVSFQGRVLALTATRLRSTFGCTFAIFPSLKILSSI